tara:strand:+ start:996 stop:1160 length:165 start_codon:yes stop_codon:yes gene_type:complete
MIREKLNALLLKSMDYNLESCIARETLINEIIKIVRDEPIESKYWRIEELDYEK